MLDRTKHLLVLSFVCFVVSAVLLLLTATAEAQQNWPKGEDSGNPANEDGAVVVDGSDGDPQYVGTPEGPMLITIWYNATGGDWVIEDGEKVYHGNHSTDMKGFDVVVKAGGRLKLENMSLRNATSIIVEPGGELVLYEDGTSNSVEIEAPMVEVRGTLTMEISDGFHARFSNLVEGLVFHEGAQASISRIDVRPAPDGMGVVVLEEGLTFEDCVFNTAKQGTAMLIHGVSSTIRDSRFRGYGQDGATGLVIVNVTGEMVIEDNTFEGIENHAIVARNSSPEITGNTFKDMEYGAAGDGVYDEYIIYMLGDEPVDKDFIIDNNTWTKNGNSGKLFMQSYELEVTVKDANTRKPLENIEVKLEGQYTDTNRQGRTDESGQVVLECAEYYIYGSPTAYAARYATEGDNPYDLWATDGESEVHEDFDRTGRYEEEELLLERKVYDFEPINFMVTTDFVGDAIFVDEDVILSCDMKNNGGEDATAVKVGFYLVDDARAELFLGEDVVNIKAMDQAGARLTLTMDEAFANIEVDFRVVANHDGAHADSDETNDEAVLYDRLVNTPPVITITAPAEGAELSEPGKVSGTVEDRDGMGVEAVQVKLADGDWKEADQDFDAWSIAWDWPFNEDIEIAVRVLDTRTYKFSWDHVESHESVVNVSVRIPADVSLADHPVYGDYTDPVYGNATDELTLEGTAIPYGSNTIASVTVKIGSGPEKAAEYHEGDNSWEYQWANLNELPRDGDYTITITATDNHDVTATITRPITILPDNPATDPVLELITKSGQTMSGASMTVEGFVLEDHQLVAVEYSVDGTSWSPITLIDPPVETNFSWQVTIARNELPITEGKENYNVWFRAHDDQTTSDLRILVIIIDDPQAPDLFLIETECSVTAVDNEFKIGSTVTVIYTVHHTGTDMTGNARVDIYVGDVLTASENATVDDLEKQMSTSFKLTEEHEGEKDVTIRIVFADDGNQGNNEVTILTPKVPEGGGDTGWFLPGFGVPLTVVVMGISAGALVCFFRWNRRH